MGRSAACRPVARSLAAAVAVGAGLAVTAQSIGGSSQTAGTAQKSSIATVRVTLTDRAFRVNPAILHSGTTVFVIHNTGKKGHAFSVSGPGVKRSRTTTLRTGGSAKLTVTLRSGTYMLSDPVGLGAYSVQYVNVVPATAMTATGSSSVVNPDVASPTMCGGSYSP